MSIILVPVLDGSHVYAEVIGSGIWFEIFVREEDSKRRDSVSVSIYSS
jgi:hypothetical protein